MYSAKIEAIADIIFTKLVSECTTLITNIVYTEVGFFETYNKNNFLAKKLLIKRKRLLDICLVDIISIRLMCQYTKLITNIGYIEDRIFRNIIIFLIIFKVKTLIRREYNS